MAALGVLVPVGSAYGATDVVVGVLWAFVRVVVGLRLRDAEAFVPVRPTLGRFLALAPEFQPAGEALRTAVAPGFRELCRPSAVAAIRTALDRPPAWRP